MCKSLGVNLLFLPRQLFMNDACHFAADAGDGGDVFHGCAGKFVYGSKVLQELLLAVWSNAGNLVERRFANAFAAQTAVIRDGKAVGFIA